jgi:anti-sigma regulatory factor (Ser/Thr protein kinase)
MLIEVTEQSQAGDARRRAVEFAERMEMSETQRGQVAIAATEIATNLVKHAGKGHILLQQFLRNGHSGLRIMGVDKGPGISDVSLALEDGHSTADSMGGGLGAIRRLSDGFDLYTSPGAGTVVDAVFWQGKDKRPAAGALAMEIACVSEPIRGEVENGDGWGFRFLPDSVILMVVDGLGHGILAAEAAREAERVLNETKRVWPEEIATDMHLALKKTRGAAASVARIDPMTGLLYFSGVGNVSATVVDGVTTRSMASHNGTLGHQMSRVQQFTCPWNKESILVMHSDGLASRWDLKRYPGISRKPPSVIAAVLHRDFQRERDDATVLVAKAVRAEKDPLHS